MHSRTIFLSLNSPENRVFQLWKPKQWQLVALPFPLKNKHASEQWQCFIHYENWTLLVQQCTDLVSMSRLGHSAVQACVVQGRCYIQLGEHMCVCVCVCVMWGLARSLLFLLGEIEFSVRFSKTEGAVLEMSAHTNRYPNLEAWTHDETHVIFCTFFNPFLKATRFLAFINSI